jgi:hypothetical protein
LLWQPQELWPANRPRRRAPKSKPQVEQPQAGAEQPQAGAEQPQDEPQVLQAGASQATSRQTWRLTIRVQVTHSSYGTQQRTVRVPVQGTCLHTQTV